METRLLGKAATLAAFFAMFATGLVATRGIVAQDRGLNVVARAVTGDPAFDAGRQYAVIIGIDKYREWPALRSAVSEAQAVKKVLAERYVIDKFYELYDEDATAANIRRLFIETLPAQIGIKDSLLVFYAGHGQTDATKTGFWIASDGSRDQFAQNNWIPNQQLRNMIGGLKAQRILILADACFSGDFLNVTRGATPIIDNAYYKKALQLTARQVLTSGASQSVPDDSEFGHQLVNLLERNDQALLDPVTMYARLRLGVTKTLPLLGTMPGNEEGSSYVLFLKGAGPGSLGDTSALASSATYSGSGGSADLMVKTDQPGATVFVDGVAKGQSPLLVRKLDAGRPLHVEARTATMSGSLDISLAPGDVKEVSLSLQTLNGNLYIAANGAAARGAGGATGPGGAGGAGGADQGLLHLYLDGKDMGPLGSGIFKGIAVGERSVELRGPNLFGSAHVTINPNETAEATVTYYPVGTLTIDAPSDSPISLSSGDWRLERRGGGTVTNVPAGQVQARAGGGSGYYKVNASLSLAQGQGLVWKPWTGGQIILNSDIPDVICLVDGIQGGVAPGSIDPISPGLHQLLFRKPGYKDQGLSVTVALGASVTAKASMELLAPARVRVPDFGVALEIAGPYRLISKTGDFTEYEVPSGLPIVLDLASSFAYRLDIAPVTMTFAAGETRTLEVPSGRIALPWIPRGEIVLLPGSSSPLAMKPTSNGYISNALPAGDYAIDVTGGYSGSVTVPAGGIAEPVDYRNQMAEAAQAERIAFEKKLSTKRAATTVGWVSFATGLVGAAGAGAVYWLGGQAMSAYKAATSTSAATDAAKTVELYQTLFPIAAGIGGAGLGLSPLFFFTGPDPRALQNSIDYLDAGIKALGK
ncbi:MAG: caspase family protein [Treponema sp.]|nr:caspase family protein [Treponema sp.]